ncbi:hypothetical protein JCM15765_41170 [Paradesulfitobacterium aromaticivorans]
MKSIGKPCILEERLTFIEIMKRQVISKIRNIVRSFESYNKYYVKLYIIFMQNPIPKSKERRFKKQALIGITLKSIFYLKETNPKIMAATIIIAG